MDFEFKYRAFISYSHSDESWAKWLHKSLETYSVPKRLVGRQTEFGPVPARFAPVFRDRDELATATNLGETLTRALEQSAFQVVICSPAAAKSRWVNEEILAFKRLGREHRIFCLIVAGEPGASAAAATADQECFPNALIYKIGEDGQLTATRGEPIAADARPRKDSKQDVRLKLVAGMLGVGLDELKQREAQRRHRRMMALVTASVVGMAITSGLAAAAWVARNQAERERVRAETEAETARQTTNFLVGLFDVSDPNEARGNSITAREILDKGSQRIKAELVTQPAIQATLMETMGTVYTSLALYPPAASLLDSSLQKRLELYGEDSLEVAQSAEKLGGVLTLTAEYDKAELMYRKALGLRQKLLGPEHVDLARSLYQLADLLGRKGEYEAADPLFRQALAMRRKLLGGNTVEVAKSLEGLALNLHSQGNYDEALPAMRLAVELQRQLHEEPHTDLAEALTNLGVVLSDMGEYRESEQLYREALQMKRVLLGDTHPEIALGLNNIAYALTDQGKYDEAASMYRQAMAMQRKLLGDDHPDIAAALNNLAFVLHEKGDAEGARRMMQQSLDMYRRTVGPEHPSIARGMGNQAMWQMEAGDYATAEPLLREALQMRRKLLGNEHTDVAGTLTLLASLLVDTRRFEEARSAAAEARAICLPALGATHWRTAAATSTEGAALAGLGQTAQGAKLLLEGLAALRADTGALPFFLNNANRWAAEYNRKRAGPQEEVKQTAMLQREAAR
ncbi:MAG: toll/interleukin-1 receptor domain-containing protein [Proteobacteria bacterium]|nr:toll/interleukin-1 receptor domain-containing protein [Pseudomonadota bacterium]